MRKVSAYRCQRMACLGRGRRRRPKGISSFAAIGPVTAKATANIRTASLGPCRWLPEGVEKKCRQSGQTGQVLGRGDRPFSVRRLTDSRTGRASISIFSRSFVPSSMTCIMYHNSGANQGLGMDCGPNKNMNERGIGIISFREVSDTRD